MTRDFLFTSESVTEGHPDKICDRISDGVLDDTLAQDKAARVACEAYCTTGLVLVGGEITTDCYVDISALVRKTLKDIGYDNCDYGINGDTCGVVVAIDQQSPDISNGVNRSVEVRENTAADDFDKIGAGDQGLMFGYACRDTDGVAEGALMPLPIHLAHALALRLAELRREFRGQGFLFLRPDGKTQVTVYFEDGRPKYIDTIVVAAQHGPNIGNDTLTDLIIERVVKEAIPKGLLKNGSIGTNSSKDGSTKVLVNPSGKFVIGGPFADTGLTGRKIIIDTYGGWARHGGGALSGKDPTKVDRSGCYYARYAAKNLVAAGAAERVEIQVAYAIGKANPVSISVDTFGTSRVPEEKMQALLADRSVFDFRPAAIIHNLGLLAPIYRQVCCYGHFGRTDLDVSWEKTDKAGVVRERLGIKAATV
jgi:S-adenosylmethionine synthetase